MPIGNPWQMVAVVILTVPVSTRGNRYLLVVQDYFIKWANTIPLSNQKASTITSALIKLFSTVGMPEIVHSDQGQNFESMIPKQLIIGCIRDIYITPKPQPIIPKEMVWLRDSTAPCYSSYVPMLNKNQSGRKVSFICLSHCSSHSYRSVTVCFDVWQATKDVSV